MEYMTQINTEKLDACPLCGSDKLTVFLQGFDYETLTGAYKIEECQDCLIKFTNPRPTASDLPKLYEDRNSSDFVKPFILIDKLRSLSIRRSLAELPKDILSGKKSVLDFGCGDGFFSKAIADFNPGIAVVATDFHSESPQRLVDHPHIKYRSQSLFKEENGQYDVIFCRHVLEHALDPAALPAGLDLPRVHRPGAGRELLGDQLVGRQHVHPVRPGEPFPRRGLRLRARSPAVPQQADGDLRAADEALGQRWLPVRRQHPGDLAAERGRVVDHAVPGYAHARALMGGLDEQGKAQLCG